VGGVVVPRGSGWSGSGSSWWSGSSGWVEW
jgi:hypothetical protein